MRVDNRGKKTAPQIFRDLLLLVPLSMKLHHFLKFHQIVSPLSPLL